MSYENLVQGGEYIQRVCGYKNVDLDFELEWVWDDYYVNIWADSGTVMVAKHLSSLGDFEAVWAWLATNYPEVDWDEQEF
jgi:hypothetical protein